jgi:RNA polymerase sigma-70 factor, ECF subfamily
MAPVPVASPTGEGLFMTEDTAERTRTDAARFHDLAAPLLPRLYAIAHRLVGDDAEDAVQDCLLKAFRSFDGLRDAEAGVSWLVAILLNCCRDRGRSRARHQEEPHEGDDLERFSLFRKISDEDPFPYSDSLHVDFLQHLCREDVHAVLWSMPEFYRVPLVLVHMEGFATKEVARMVDRPLGTVLARLHRGRKLFERRLWDHAEVNGLLTEGAG